MVNINDSHKNNSAPPVDDDATGDQPDPEHGKTTTEEQHVALNALHDAVHNLAETWSEIDDPDLFCQFTCQEINALTDVLEIVGASDAALTILHFHALCDEDDDAHGHLTASALEFLGLASDFRPHRSAML